MNDAEIFLEANLKAQLEIADGRGDHFRQRIRTIWKNVANGVGDRGNFLRAYGNAICAADEFNFSALLPTAVFLISKYDLDKPEYWREP